MRSEKGQERSGAVAAGRGEGRFVREQRERGREGERKEWGDGREETEVWKYRTRGKTAAAGEKSRRGRKRRRGRGTNTPKRCEMIETEQDRAKRD